MKGYTLGKDYIRKEVEVEKINGSCLKSMYDILNCDTVNVREFEVEGKYYDIWFDDEFLLKERNNVATFLIDYGMYGKDIICGNWLIIKSDEHGECTGLNEEDMEILRRYTELNAMELRKYVYNMRK